MKNHIGLFSPYPMGDASQTLICCFKKMLRQSTGCMEHSHENLFCTIRLIHIFVLPFYSTTDGSVNFDVMFGPAYKGISLGVLVLC